MCICICTVERLSVKGAVENAVDQTVEDTTAPCMRYRIIQAVTQGGLIIAKDDVLKFLYNYGTFRVSQKDLQIRLVSISAATSG